MRDRKDLSCNLQDCVSGIKKQLSKGSPPCPVPLLCLTISTKRMSAGRLSLHMAPATSCAGGFMTALSSRVSSMLWRSKYTQSCRHRMCVYRGWSAGPIADSSARHKLSARESYA